jgi:hypothetical protein
MLIPPDEFRPETATTEAGDANGRALAYLAHLYLGEAFGTLYDLSTIAILWFAGASALAGLLNIVPRYLPRYGMAPEWARATRPLVVVFTVICFFVTILFRADVDAQGGAYATGVLALMTSAAIAVTLSARRHGELKQWFFILISLVFAYTTITNIVEQPEGIKIALVFIVVIVLSSLASRVWRSTELRVGSVELDDTAREFVRQAAKGTVRIITNRCDRGDAVEYEFKEREKRLDNHFPRMSQFCFSKSLQATHRNSPAFFECAVRTWTAFRCFEPNLRPFQMRLPHFFCFFETRRGNCHTSISDGAKAIRSHTY